MDEKDINTSSQVWENVMKFTNKAPQYLNQIQPFMGSLDNLFKTKDGKEAFSHMFEMLKHANQFRTTKNKPKSSTGAKQQQPSLTGNHIYDLFSSPGLKDVVKEVMAAKGKAKHKPRRKKKR